jgi:hypothetical protein
MYDIPALDFIWIKNLCEWEGIYVCFLDVLKRNRSHCERRHKCSYLVTIGDVFFIPSFLGKHKVNEQWEHSAWSLGCLSVCLILVTNVRSKFIQSTKKKKKKKKKGSKETTDT